MTADQNLSRWRVRMVLVAALAGLLAASGAVYVTMTGAGNDQSAQACAAGRETAARIAPLIGGEVAALAVADRVAPVADIGFVDGAGAPRRLADWRGRTVLVNLWATWCAPCRYEMPALDRLQAALGGDGFEVVAVNLDRGGPDKGVAFYEEIGLGALAYYHDPEGRIFRDLAAFGMPTTLIIDQEGCEIARMAGPAEWDSEDALRVLRAVLNEPPPRTASHADVDQSG